jgi:trigger factor
MTTAEPHDKIQFQDDDVTVHVHRKPASRVEFEMHVSAKITKSAHKHAIKEVAKEVSLPGFRKGKAPDHLVEKNYPGQIDQRWQELIASQAMKDGEKLSKIAPLARNSRVSFSMKRHDLENGADLSISFETEPLVPNVNPKDLELKKVERPIVDETRVTETIRQVLFFFAKWEPIETRAVEQGDFVLLDVDDMEQGFPQPIFNNTRFEVAEKKMAKWMLDLVIGKQKNESADGVSLPDDDASEEEKAAFKPKNVRLTIRLIERAELPELDDAFAKQLGVENLKDLHEQISRLLNKQADAHVQSYLREQVNEQLLLKYPFDIPHSLVERETQFRMRHLLQDPEFQKYWMGMSDHDRQNSVKSIFEQSQKAVRMFYLCRKIAEDAKITVSPKDLPAPASNALEMLLQPAQPSPYGGEPEVQQAEAFSRILLEKTEDFLIANALLSE